MSRAWCEIRNFCTMLKGCFGSAISVSLRVRKMRKTLRMLIPSSSAASALVLPASTKAKTCSALARAVSPVSPHYGKRAARLETERRLRGGLFPPSRNEAPTHRDKLGAGLCQPHDIDRCCRSDVVSGPQVARRLCQPVKLDQFAPRVALGEASARKRAARN